MKSAIFREPGRPLEIVDRPDPEPGPDDIVIRVARCGICGSDVQMTDPACPIHFAGGSALGHEYAGEVVARGRDVTSIAVGDTVTAVPVAGCGRCAACRAGEPYGCPDCTYLMGGFSHYTVARASLASKLPAGVTVADGALIEPLACGSQAVRLSGISAGKRVMVIGQGAIGLGAIFWSRLAGAEKIAGVALSDRNSGLAATMGATAYVQQGEDLAARVADALGGPPDVVIDCAGRPGLIAQAVECAGNGGTIAIAGLCYTPDSFIPGYASAKQLRFQFSMAYTMEDFRRGLDAFAAGHVEPRAMVSETIGLSALPEMLEALRHDRTRCKILVDPWA